MLRRLRNITVWHGHRIFGQCDDGRRRGTLGPNNPTTVFTKTGALNDEALNFAITGNPTLNGFTPNNGSGQTFVLDNSGVPTSAEVYSVDCSTYGDGTSSTTAGPPRNADDGRCEVIVTNERIGGPLLGGERADQDGREDDVQRPSPHVGPAIDLEP